MLHSKRSCVIAGFEKPDAATAAPPATKPAFLMNERRSMAPSLQRTISAPSPAKPDLV
jgi:hypothetical protein